MRFIGLSLLALSGFAAALSKRDLATLQGDLQQLNTQVSKLSQDLQAYQGGYKIALGIYNEAEAVADLVAKTTQDAKAQGSKLSAADSTTLVNALDAAKPNIVGALNNFVNAHAVFTKYNIANIAKVAGNDIKGNVGSLVSSFFAIIDASTTKQAAGILQEINDAFAKVDAAYANDN